MGCRDASNGFHCWLSDFFTGMMDRTESKQMGRYMMIRNFTLQPVATLGHTPPARRTERRHGVEPPRAVACAGGCHLRLHLRDDDARLPPLSRQGCSFGRMPLSKIDGPGRSTGLITPKPEEPYVVASTARVPCEVILLSPLRKGMAYKVRRPTFPPQEGYLRAR